jgi:hypothetical protein
MIVDVSKDEEQIRDVANARFNEMKTNGTQRTKDLLRFYRYCLRSTATELAAVEILKLSGYPDLTWDTSDAAGLPDIVTGDLIIDVKHLNENTRNASIEYWENTLHKKQDWTLMIIEGQGVGWKFNLCGYYRFLDLQHKTPNPASHVHSRPYWLLNENELYKELSDTP